MQHAASYLCSPCWVSVANRWNLLASGVQNYQCCPIYVGTCVNIMFRVHRLGQVSCGVLSTSSPHDRENNGWNNRIYLDLSMLLLLSVISLRRACKHKWKNILRECHYKRSLENQRNYHRYLICDLVVTTGIPVTIAIALYTAIALKMCTRKTPGNQTASRTTRNRTINRKVISMLTTVVLCFCVCLMPA